MTSPQIFYEGKQLKNISQGDIEGINDSEMSAAESSLSKEEKNDIFMEEVEKTEMLEHWRQPKKSRVFHFYHMTFGRCFP